MEFLRGDPRYLAQAAGFWLRRQVHGRKRYGFPAKITRHLRMEDFRKQSTAACVLGLMSIGLIAGKACNIMLYCRIV
jgi:hypothetical protein